MNPRLRHTNRGKAGPAGAATLTGRTSTGGRVAHLLSGRMLDYVEVDEDFAMIKTKPPRDIVGVPLRESRLRSKYGITIVAVKPEAPPPGTPRAFTYATADTTLMYGDIILAVGAIDALERLAASE